METFYRFEMLVNNFSAGILGGILAIFSFKVIEPIVTAFSNGLSSLATSVTDAGLLPLISLAIEPGKILFLNNAINHGILTPLGLEQAETLGKSVFFLLEANPGPGLGILLAYTIFGKGNAKQSAPGAVIIHALGGIHEIYFPYILMKPALLIAAIAAGMAGNLTFLLLDAGLVAAASPGSIIAVLGMTPKGSHLGVIAGMAVATVVSFLIASVILKGSKGEEENLEDAHKIKGMKAESKGNIAPKAVSDVKVDANNVNLIVFACDAGMDHQQWENLYLKEIKEADFYTSKT